MMTLTAHQPAYLPWLGYFDKLVHSDLFIYLDTVQYEKNSFTNRNRIKGPQGEIMLTVPVFTKGHTSETMRTTRIDNRFDWRKKHLNSIYVNYKKAPYFEENFVKLESLYDEQEELLANFCLNQLTFWLKELGFSKTQIIRSSTLDIDTKKSDLVFDLCSHFKADHYISGALGKDYLDEDKFVSAGICIEYQDYHYPVYSQLWGDFKPFMSILDFWMNSKEFNLIVNGKNDQFTSE